MRIIAGQFKGRILAAPKGQTTRPTTDRVREALMSAIGSARGGFQDACVLDAFAGSGALGLESLSRGAAYACFYENNADTFKVLASNSALLKVSEKSLRINRCDILKHPPLSQYPAFDLVFLDPPYALEAFKVFSLIEALAGRDALADDALICYEHDKAHDLAVDSNGGVLQTSLPLTIVSHKVYGDSAIDLLRKEHS
ncbi:MAG: 16S rRNA (guanine(966)-N(2))-methyltransferase RsmD [Raoultibacter sp.]